MTKKIRRVGQFDPDLVRQAVIANGGAPTVRVALTMFDYLFPELHGKDSAELDDIQKACIQEIELQIGARVGLLGTSPTTMIEVN